MLRRAYKVRNHIITTPYANHIARHPLFVRETRRARWAWSPADFRRKTRRVLLMTTAIMIGLWIGLSLLWYGEIMRNASYYSNMPERALYNAGGNAISILFLLALLGGSAIDFGGVRASLDSISGEVATRRWDLLRLTSLNEKGMVQAKHAVAQLRMWRTTTRLMSMRGALLLVLLIYVWVLPALLFGDYSFWNSLQYNAVVTLGTLVVSGLVSVVFVIEPLWRMKAMTAFGMLISSYVENTALATLASLGAVLVLWLMQMIIIGTLWFGSAFLGSNVFFVAYYTNSQIAVIIYLVFVGLITTVTIYGFYHLLQTWSLWRVTQRIRTGN